MDRNTHSIQVTLTGPEAIMLAPRLSTLYRTAYGGG